MLPIVFARGRHRTTAHPPPVTRLLRLALALIPLSLTAMTARAATLTVTSAADSGAGSLRQAVSSAGAGDTIVFAPGVTSIVLTSGEIGIGQPITIQGPGVTVDGNHSSRVFHIYAGSAARPVALTGLIIRNAFSSGLGGGVLAEDGTAVALTSCALVANATNGSADGGGLFGGNGTTVLMTGCTVTGNSAFSDGGGGVENFGNSVLTDCIVYNNAGGDAALYNGVTVSHCDIGGYPATPDANGNFGANPQFVSGTDLHLKSNSPCIGAGVTVPGATLDIAGVPYFAPPGLGAYEYVNQGLVVTSTADNGPGSLRAAVTTANAAPHSLITFDPNGFASLKTITLTGGALNVTAPTAILAPAAGVAVDGGHHDRVLVVLSGGLSAVGLTVQNGFVNSGGGGIFLNNGVTASLTACTFVGNQASGNDGGGVQVYGAGVTFTGCVFTGNSASQGGGLWTSGQTTLTNCVFNGNSAQQGGGVLVYYGANAVVTSCTFTGNSADQGGGLYNTGKAALTDDLFYNEIGFDFSNYGPISYSYCDFGQGIYPSSGNISVNPQFVSATDFHVQPGSPIIAMGTASAPGNSYLPYDITGATRAGTPTIGAYEGVAAGTATTLTSSANPSAAGQSVTFTATVGNTSNGIVPVGSVVFTVDGAAGSPVALDGNGQAILTTSSLSVGTHTVSAAFAANARFTASASGTAQQVVNKAATTTTLARTAGNAAVKPGDPLAFTATVSGGTPTGTVTFTYTPVGGAAPVTDTQPLVGTSASDSPTLPVGKYTVTATYNGDGNSSASTSAPALTQTVDTPPTISGVPSDLVVEATGAAGAVVTFSGITATDALDGTLPVTVLPVSGSTFPLGATTVQVSAVNSSGMTTTATFHVTVADTTAPTITLSGANPMTVSAGGTFTDPGATATDTVDGSVPVAATGTVNTAVPGTYTITYKATDSHSNTATKTRTVTVVDTTPPAFSGTVQDITAEATGPGGAAVTFTLPTATDSVDGSVTVTADHRSGDTFPLGTTTVHYTAMDKSGNTALGSFKVTVVDTTPPTITRPADMTVQATSSAGAVVSFTVSATDLVDGSVATNASPASGSTFPLGTTTVTVTSTDAHGNKATATFKVTVADTTPPTITKPADITAEATGPGGAVVTFSVSATDLVDGTVTATATPASGSVFPVGATTVTVAAKDKSGNTATATFKVTVADTTPPTITAPADITVSTTSPSGTAVTFSATAADLVDGAVPVSASPASGSVFPIGTTVVTLTAIDAHGNKATASFKVTVKAVAALAGVSVAPSSVTGGYGVTGTVTLTVPAAVSTVVSLQSGSASATVPASVTVPAGQTSATFPVATKAVSANTAVTLTAAYSGVSKTATLTLTPAPCMTGFTVAPGIVVGGTTATGTITLSAPAAPGGYAVCLFGLPGLPGLPASVTVPQGQSALTFPIPTQATDCLYASLIFAVSSDSIGVSSLIVTPVPKVVTLDLPGSVKGGQSTTGTVTLNTIAATPITVSLSAIGPVSVPATVTIPAGSCCASFTVAASAVSKTTGATVTASYGGSSQSDTISVTH